jgi:hypothetical protein
VLCAAAHNYYALRRKLMSPFDRGDINYLFLVNISLSKDARNRISTKFDYILYLYNNYQWKEEERMKGKLKIVELVLLALTAIVNVVKAIIKFIDYIKKPTEESPECTCA